ncbi:MAG: hypothetical protein ACYC6N_26565 [Pirellulaceae bacterium]
MIAAVSVGLSVDSSIHYITSFRRALSQGMSVGQAIGSVQQTVDRGMIFSTLVLVVGFSVLCTSPYRKRLPTSLGCGEGRHYNPLDSSLGRLEKTP